MQDLDMQSLGMNILVARRHQHLSQRDLATLAEVDLSTLSRLERGQKPRVDGNTLYRLSQALGVSLDALTTPVAWAQRVSAPGRGRPPKRRPAAEEGEAA